jgi:L-ribulose-5-phosphate 3-epimerase
MYDMTQIFKSIGVCSWSLVPKDDHALVASLRHLSINSVQLAMTPLVEQPDQWGGVIASLRSEKIEVVSGMFEPIGEDYTTLDTIRQTGGIVPDEHWPGNLDRAGKIAALCKEHDIKTISFHAGFIPHDASDPEHEKLCGRLAAMADVFAEAGCVLLLETGQETAEDLSRTLDVVARDNLAINFDPANMILYDKGDPIAALRHLIHLVKQVHIKDAIKTKTPGQWGEEVPVGCGGVDWPAFFEVLRGAGYSGSYIIEREAGDNRAGDIVKARELIASHLSGATRPETKV